MYKRQEEYLETIGAKINPRIPVKNLGVAAQQMVEIAKALATDCKILILDEPTAVPVSYTHLDVYKRQVRHRGENY